MRKNVRKILISVTLVFVLMVVGIFNVYSGGSNGSGDSAGSGNSCKDCKCKYVSDEVQYHMWGMRISLIDSNGKRIPGTSSIDVFSSATPTTNNKYENTGVYVVQGESASTKFTKMEFFTTYYGGNGKEEVVDIPLVKTSIGSLGIVSAEQVGFDSSFKISTNPYMQSNDYVADVKNLYETLADEADAKSYEFSEKLFIENLHFKSPKEFTKEDIENTYILIEPLIGFTAQHAKMNGSAYSTLYGTVTELAGALYGTSKCKNSKGESYYLSASIIQRTGIMLYGTQPCNTAPEDQDKCTPHDWPAVTQLSCGSDYSAGRNCAKKLLTQNSYGVGYVWLGSLPYEMQGCTEIVAYINQRYESSLISEEEYHQMIDQVEAGTFSYTDEDGKVIQLDSPQSFEMLVKENYEKYNNGLAACADRQKVSLDCEAAINYINSNYRRGTQAYHNAVDQVEAGTFTYELPDGTTVSIDKPYTYNMLNKNVYTKQGGVAQCNDIMINVCSTYDGADINIDDCSTGSTYFRDINDEEAWLICEIAYTNGSKVYSSDNTGHDAVETDNGGIVGNAEYCEVFCYEEFETNFPTHVYGVKAGQTFTWGTSDGTFGTVKIRKKCSNQNYVKGQQGYRFEEWEEDYKDNEEAMIRHFMKNGAYESMISGITSSSSSYNTCDWRCSTCRRKDGTTYSCGCRYRGCPRWKATARSSGTSESYSHGYIGGVTGSVSTQTYSVSGYMSSSAAKSAAEAGLKSKLQSLAASEEARYSQRKNEEAELIEKIEQCTNNIEYVYKSTIQFTFKEPVNSRYGANSRSFEFDDNLLVEGDYNKNNVDTSKCVRKTIYKYTCSGYASGVTCSPEAKQVWDCTVVTWDIEGDYTYKYPVEHFQWYTLKTNSTLVNKDKKGTEDEAFFYSIGFGLPTALSLTDGTYELKTTVYDIGDNARFSGGAPLYERPVDTHFDPVAPTVDTKVGSKNGFEYVCTYVVDNEIFGYDCQYDASGNLIYESPSYCDEDKDDDSEGALLGIDITYRLVTLLSDGDTLDKAFPSREGDGREPGINWKVTDEDIVHILRDDVYNEPAMYEIMLDVNAIQKIRKDNQTYFDGGKDPYASYYDAYNAQKVYCAEKGDEKYCASDFISDLYNGSELNYRLLGTCLPTGNTLERAEYILENGCDTHYTYPKVNWER